MPHESLLITDFDQQCLLKMLAQTSAGVANDAHVRSLAVKLDCAVVVDSESIPSDVVTMHSRVRLVERNSCKRLTVKLVFPSEAQRNKEQRISVLAPVGAAIFGRKEGDTIKVAQEPDHNSYKIDKVVYQPEANGWLL